MYHFIRSGKGKVAAFLLAITMLITTLQTSSIVFAKDISNKSMITFSTTDTSPKIIPLSTSSFVLNANDLEAKTYDTTFEINGFMITATNEKTVAVDANSKTADDGTSYSQRIKLGGTGTAEYRSVRFHTSSAATVKIYAMSSSSSADRQLNLYDMSNNLIGSVPAYGTELKVGTIAIDKAGEYYLASPESGVNVYCVIVTPEGEETENPRKDWRSVEVPRIIDVTQDGSKLVVTLELVTGNDGADKATVHMMNETGEIIDSILIGTDPNTTRTVAFTPKDSGNYCFRVVAERVGEPEVKESTITDSIAFLLPLVAPSLKSATSKGNGTVEITWEPVPEATSYYVYYKQADAMSYSDAITVEETSAFIQGLKVGVTYTFAVKAVRGLEESDLAEIEVTVTSDTQRTWYFAAFGQGVNTTNNYYSGSASEGTVTIASENGKGKLVPASTDGLAFYYTTIDPEKENFILSATVTVDSWTYSNGQEGFGLMAADAVGTHGDSSSFWNNSYMTTVTKVEYFWDTENQKVSDSGEKITMKLGIGAQEKKGVTAENIADGSIVTNINELFSSTMAPLETSCAAKGAGTYNIVGNYLNAEAPVGTVPEEQLSTSFKLSIQRDNTGYRLSYTDKYGNTTSKLYYDIQRDALTKIDKDAIYVGFFASRNANITVTDISLTTSDPATDPPAEQEGITYITPSYKILSPKATGIEDYELVFLGNADGILTIKDTNGRIIMNEVSVTANTYVKKQVKLEKGNNQFLIEFTPDADYKPGKNQLLSSYEKATFTHEVLHKIYNRNDLYVAPNGTADGKGNKNSPLDIYTAVKFVRPGQRIILAGGTYSLTETITVERGINGTAKKRIELIVDPSSKTRPVFDFNQACAGMVFAGDYWYISGFDVTKSADMQKGIQLSGDHCILDQVNTYYNGNTGIQISRYLTTDQYEDWPSYNLVLNCTSYGNADRGYEDADGFAAKLTVGDGNVFDGCIAYNNADDGWDLFAKPETGPIGQVIIRNCVTFGNGYLPDGTNAGNGNGFKLGGSSIEGNHKLIHCVAFDNKAKGIDSNSGPNVEIYQCTTFNNGSYNVAFYTNDAANTAFFADGILSFRTANTSIGENIKPKGTQDMSKIYGNTNYYWDGVSQTSKNAAGKMVSEDWFANLDTSTKITRKKDGTIQMNGLLELTKKAPKGVGARIGGLTTNEALKGMY